MPDFSCGANTPEFSEKNFSEKEKIFEPTEKIFEKKEKRKKIKILKNDFKAVLRRCFCVGG